MNVNFYLKNKTKARTSVEAVIRHKGNRFKLSSGLSVETKFWDKSTHRAQKTKDYPDHELINLKLEDFEIKVRKIFADAIRNDKTPTIEQIKSQIQSEETTPVGNLFLSYFRHYYETANIKAKTSKNYGDTATFIAAYEESAHHRHTFDDINMTFYTNFRNYVITKKKKDGNHYSMNYFGGMIKHIKTVMRDAGPEGMKLHRNEEYRNRKFVKEAEEADTVYLSVDELDRINQLIIDEKTVKANTRNLSAIQLKHKTARLIHIRNLLMIGCFTALRISDFSRIDWSNIGDKYIRIKPVKGSRKNEDVVIPVHPVLKAIFAGSFRPEIKTGPGTINSGIRLLCRMAKIKEPVTTVRTEGGQEVSRTVPKWKVISSHTARRSGATNMYISGIPAISIMKITGHRTERSFMRYLRISQEENARLLAEHPFFKTTK